MVDLIHKHDLGSLAVASYGVTCLILHRHVSCSAKEKSNTYSSNDYDFCKSMVRVENIMRL